MSKFNITVDFDRTTSVLYYSNSTAGSKRITLDCAPYLALLSPEKRKAKCEEIETEMVPKIKDAIDEAIKEDMKLSEIEGIIRKVFESTEMILKYNAFK